jgi:SNF2 family DNA or RNA helicase
MLTPDKLHDYQKKAVNHQCTKPNTMLWLDMGLGKTVITLTSIAHLLNAGFLNGVLIVAPIRVIRLVWKQEAKKWGHTKDLRFVSITGDRDQRIRALMQPADVYLVNYENLKWLAETLVQYYINRGKSLPFTGLVWDEISKMKNSTTNRVQAWFSGQRKQNLLDHFVWTTGLTGTPASNGYKDLHGQYLVIDRGQRLGTSKTKFKQRHYYKPNGSFKEIPFENAEEEIKHLISDITLEMSAEDYNPLPDLIVNDVWVEMSGKVREQYESLEKEFFFNLDNGSSVEAFNAAALTNKCLQFSNGAVYPIAGLPVWEEVHDLKLEALEDIIDEAQGSPILCAYAYRSDAERIMEKFKTLRPINLTACKSEKSLNDAMNRWKSGDCALMIGHPASMGHGIDGLQKNGHILVWYGLNWSLDLVDQFNARIRRQGLGVPAICHRIMTKDTLDAAQRDALEGKARTETALRKAINEYRKTKGY